MKLVLALLLCAWPPVALAGQPASAQRPTRPLDRPVLRIWGAKWCEPCRRLVRDWETDRVARETIAAKYTVCWVSVDQYRAQALSRGIHELPAIELPTGRILTGYRGLDQLLASLGAQRTTEQQSPPTSPVVPPPPAEPELATPIWASELQHRLADQHAGLIERIGQIEQRQHEHGSELHRAAADVAGVRSDAAQVGSLAKVVNGLKDGLPGVVASAVKPLIAERAAAGGWMGVASLLAAGSGVGLPVAGGLLLVSALRAHRRSQSTPAIRLQTPSRPASPEPRNVPVSTEPPPTPARLGITRREFVPYPERDPELAALREAMKRIGQDYPVAAQYFHQAETLCQLVLSGHESASQ